MHPTPPTHESMQHRTTNSSNDDAWCAPLSVPTDNPGEDILAVLFEALEFIDSALRSGGHVLVHCSQGVSRSATLAIAYIMWKSGQSFDQAMTQVKAARGIAMPNIGFTCQLLQWQKARNIGAPLRTRLYCIAPHCQMSPLMLLPKVWTACACLWTDQGLLFLSQYMDVNEAFLLLSYHKDDGRGFVSWALERLEQDTVGGWVTAAP